MAMMNPGADEIQDAPGSQTVSGVSIRHCHQVSDAHGRYSIGLDAQGQVFLTEAVGIAGRAFAIRLVVGALDLVAT